MRAALYARVSTEEQVEGWSPDAQLAACRVFCQSKSWTVAEEYVDAGESGTTANRPQLSGMLAAAKARKSTSSCATGWTASSATCGNCSRRWIS